MSIDTLKKSIGDYGRDIRINISRILTEDGAPGLTETQIYGVALACAYCTKSRSLIEAIISDTDALPQEVVHAAKASATIMAMNNVYYRFIHLVQDKEYGQMPASLRMTVIANPGVPKVDFELMCLAVSAINGCGACMDSHARTVRQESVSAQGVQSAVRIASVIHATAQALSIN